MITIRNIGSRIKGLEIDPKKAFIGTSRFITSDGVEYTCGVNATWSGQDLIGDAWIAADSKMVLVNRT